MFLHLGGEIVVRTKDVIAILNVEKNKAWFRSLPKGVQAKTADHGSPEEQEGIKSLVITDDAVYHSPISSSTLKKRAEQLSNPRD